MSNMNSGMVCLMFIPLTEPNTPSSGLIKLRADGNMHNAYALQLDSNSLIWEGLFRKISSQFWKVLTFDFGKVISGKSSKALLGFHYFWYLMKYDISTSISRP